MEKRSKIDDILVEQGIQVMKRRHKPVFTIKEAASARGCGLDDILKALVLLDNQNNSVVALLLGNRKLDLKKLSRTLKVKKIRLVDKNLVKAITGFDPGAVPPFGFRESVRTVMDESVFSKEAVHCSAGSHTMEMIIRVKDLAKIVNPIVSDISIT